MNKLKKFIKANLSTNTLDTILWGQPTSRDYQTVIHHYRLMDKQHKIDLEEKVIKKLQRVKQNEIHLGGLHLINLMIQQGYQFPALLKQTSSLALSNSNKNKDQEIASKFYKIYYKVVANNNNKLNHYEPVLTVNEKIKYCEMSIANIRFIIQQKQVISCYLQNSNNKVLTLIVLDAMLREVSKDMSIMNDFIRENLCLILKEHPQMIRINYIYESLIGFSKPNILCKLDELNSKLDNKYSFQQYKIDQDLNSAIENTMKKHRNQCQQYLVGKLLPVRNLTMQNPEQNMARDPTIVDEEDILVNYDEFFN